MYYETAIIDTSEMQKKLGKQLIFNLLLFFSVRVHTSLKSFKSPDSLSNILESSEILILDLFHGY